MRSSCSYTATLHSTNYIYAPLRTAATLLPATCYATPLRCCTTRLHQTALRRPAHVTHSNWKRNSLGRRQDQVGIGWGIVMGSNSSNKKGERVGMTSISRGYSCSRHCANSDDEAQSAIGLFSATRGTGLSCSEVTMACESARPRAPAALAKAACPRVPEEVASRRERFGGLSEEFRRRFRTSVNWQGLAPYSPTNLQPAPPCQPSACELARLLAGLRRGRPTLTKTANWQGLAPYSPTNLQPAPPYQPSACELARLRQGCCPHSCWRSWATLTRSPWGSACGSSSRSPRRSARACHSALSLPKSVARCKGPLLSWWACNKARLWPR